MILTMIGSIFHTGRTKTSIPLTIFFLQNRLPDKVRRVKSVVATKFHSEPLLIPSRFCRNDDRSVFGTSTVQRGCRCTFQYRDLIYVLRIQTRKIVAPVRFITTVFPKFSVVHRNPVDHVQRLVVPGDRSISPNRDPCRASRS